jgi:ATP-dependent DNA ligase
MNNISDEEIDEVFKDKMNDIFEEMLPEKLGPMKCIHLNPEKDNIENYFYKRRFHTLYAQPKYNGIRALWYHNNGLHTRNDNAVSSVPHIVEELEQFFPSTDLDGELYHPTMHFNDINGASRRIEPTSNSLKLEYHIFDQPIKNIMQLDRLKLNEERLSEVPGSSPLKEVFFTPTTPGHLDYMLRLYLSQGFEGMVVRAPLAPYREGRHVGNLWAVKPVYEIEAMFLGFLPPGDNTLLHSDTFGSLLLKLPSNGRTFSCSGITENERVKLWETPPEEGTLITVKFGAWSHSNPEKAVPLFPRFKCLRWDIK